MTVDGCWQGAVFCNAQGGFELTTPTKMKRTAFEWQKKKYAFNRAQAADLPHAKETLWHWATEAITKLSIYLNSYTQSEILDEIKIFAMPKENSVSKSRKKNSKFIFFRIWSLDFSSFTSYGFLLPKGRTPNSQKSARISIDLESISDCVGDSTNSTSRNALFYFLFQVAVKVPWIFVYIFIGICFCGQIWNQEIKMKFSWFILHCL